MANVKIIMQTIYSNVTVFPDLGSYSGLYYVIMAVMEITAQIIREHEL